MRNKVGSILNKPECLIMVSAKGFYPIKPVPGVPLKQQAKDHGLLNDHILRVEDLDGNVLWQRTIQ